MKLTRNVEVRESIHQFVTIAAPFAAFAAIVLAEMLVRSLHERAQSDGASFDPARVARGLETAPVHSTDASQNRNLVGYGSWLVNAVADCNGCHNGGSAPNFNYAANGNP